MEALRIRLLGSVDVHWQDRKLCGFATRNATGLFASLVLAGGRLLTRPTLASQFWGDLPEPHARRALNTAFWRVRDVFGKAGLAAEIYFDSSAAGIRFRAESPHWTDVAQVESAASRAAISTPASADDELLKGLEAAVALYRGDLLQDLYDDWCLVQREAFRATHLRALEFLMQAWMARGHWSKAVTFGQRLLAVDAMQEHVHRALMRCHYFMGNRPAALQQFQACAKLLRRELGVEPMAETMRVRDTIVSGASAAPTSAQQAPAPVRSGGDGGAASTSALDNVNLAIVSIDSARDRLVEASETLHLSQARYPHR